jgi:hypothetical protein
MFVMRAEKRRNVSAVRATPRFEESETGSGRTVVTIALLVAMFATSLISWSTAAVLPRWFATNFHSLAESADRIGILVGSAYLIGSFGQYASARLTARFSLKQIYLGAMALELPFLVIAATISGVGIYPIALCMVFASSAQLAPETLLIARYAPSVHRGLAFGIRFILSFAAAPVAVQLAALSYGATGDFTLLFGLLAVVSCSAIAAVVLFLPTEEAKRA